MGAGPTDDELLREARGGAREALARFVDRHLEPLFGYADMVTGVAADASAVVQDAFLDTFIATREEGESVTEPAKRLWRNVHQTSLKAAELRRRGAATPVEEAPEIVPPEDDLAAILRRANMELPPRQREVVVMHELEDFSYEFIANVMDLSPFTVAQLSWRGLGRMRALIRRDPHGAQHVDAERDVRLADLQCDNAMTLLALRKEQPLPDDEVAAWLDRHLGGCSSCATSAAALDDAEETVDAARATYRRWARVRAGVGLRDLIIQEAEAAFGAERAPAEARPEPAPKREPLLRRKVGDLRGRRRLAIPATAAIFLTLLLGALATHLMTFEGGDGTPPSEDRRIAGLQFGPIDLGGDDDRGGRDPTEPECRGENCRERRVCRGADCDGPRVCRGAGCDEPRVCRGRQCDRRPVCRGRQCDRRPVCRIEPCDLHVCRVEPCDRRPVCRVEPCDRRPVCRVEPCDRQPCPPDCPPPPCPPDCPPPPCPPDCPPPCPPDCPPPPCPPNCPPPPCPPDCPPPPCPPDCDPPVRQASGPPGLGGDLPPGRGGGEPPGKAPGRPPGHGGAVLPPGRGGTPPGQQPKLG